jgi:hypothetical protein
MYIPILFTKQNNTSESSLVSYVLNMGWVMWILASSVPSFPYQNQQYPSHYVVKGTCWSQNQQYPAHYKLKVGEQPRTTHGNVAESACCCISQGCNLASKLAYTADSGTRHAHELALADSCKGCFLGAIISRILFLCDAIPSVTMMVTY